MREFAPMSQNQQRFLTYLNCYAQKDLSGIADLLADNVRLRDWNISVQGRAAVLAETATNFANAKSLHIETLQMYGSPNSVAGELRIVVDGHIELFVVDVLDFDAQGKIEAVRAYLGRG